MNKNKLSQGFTLIEILVVIILLAIISTAVIAVINPSDKIALANDSAVQSTIAQLGSANQAYAVSHNGGYIGPGIDHGTVDATQQMVGTLRTEGEVDIKSAQAPSGYAIYYAAAPVGCTTAAGDCTSFTLWTELKAQKYKNTAGSGRPIFLFRRGEKCVAAQSDPSAVPVSNACDVPTPTSGCPLNGYCPIPKPTGPPAPTK